MNHAKVIFYEWSDVKRNPIEFYNVENFINFCIESNIRVSKKNLNFFNYNDTVYCVCKPHLNELVMSGDYRNLRKNYSKHKCKK